MLLEDFRGEIFEIFAPVFPRMEAAGLVDFRLDAGCVKKRDGCIGVLQRDDILARTDPRELEYLARSAVFREIGVIFFFLAIRKSSGAEDAGPSD